jgi:hypothetical protein
MKKRIPIDWERIRDQLIEYADRCMKLAEIMGPTGFPLTPEQKELVVMAFVPQFKELSQIIIHSVVAQDKDLAIENAAELRAMIEEIL